MSRFVLDSYALLSVWRNEASAVSVRKLLASTRDEHWMSVVNLGEVYYRVAREDGLLSSERALVWAESLPISFVDADRDLALDAAKIKARYALSYADCFAAALAQRFNAPVVTGDEEFRKLEDAGIIEVEWLSVKPKTSRR